MENVTFSLKVLQQLKWIFPLHLFSDLFNFQRRHLNIYFLKNPWHMITFSLLSKFI